MIYKPFSVVVVPFPFTDSSKRKRRPALVISTEKFQIESGHVTMLMITSAKHSQWYGDVRIQELQPTKLPVESIIRQKIFTIDSRLIERELGKLALKDVKQITQLVRQCISI
jgi:mRNA interferase MazF